MEELVKKEGFPFRFNPKACFTCKGNCCIGESGYIWVSPDESKSIANSLHVNLDEFMSKYLLKVGYRFSLKEKMYDGGFACIFFDEEELRCSIYDVRPSQCRTFPFWNHFKTHIKEVERECPGILV